jgi:hypothetical protein
MGGWACMNKFENAKTGGFGEDWGGMGLDYWWDDFDKTGRVDRFYGIVAPGIDLYFSKNYGGFHNW